MQGRWSLLLKMQKGKMPFSRRLKREISTLLMKTGLGARFSSHDVIPISSSLGLEILKKMVQTNRCHMGSLANAPLIWAQTLSGQFKWIFSEDGRVQRLVPMSDNPDFKIRLLSEHCVYIDSHSNSIGELRFQEAPKALEVLFKAPSIVAEDVNHIKNTFISKAPPSQLAPNELKREEVRVQPISIRKIAAIN